MTRIWRGPFGIAFRHGLRLAGPVSLFAALIAVAVHAATADPELAAGAAAAASAAASPWLTLPLAAAALCILLRTLQLWPTMTLRQSGRDAIQRVTAARAVLPTGGRFAAIGGAIALQLLLTAPLAVALTWWFDAPPVARRHHVAAAVGPPVLDGVGQTLAFALAAPVPVEAIWIRADAAIPTGPAPTSIEILQDGQALSDRPLTIAESRQLARAPIDPGRTAGSGMLATFSLRHAGGDVPLLFRPGSVVAIGPSDRTTWINALMLSALATGASAAILLACALLGLGAGIATVTTAGCALWFLLWLGSVGPVDDAILAVLRGRWLW
ncbi:MAG: hypothetical protein AB8H80_13915 [Planctomycetota bacterium]